MKYQFLLFIVLIISNTLYSQSTDTIFFDDKWEQLDSRENALYYRIIEGKKKFRYVVKDYYISGRIQMEGQYSNKKLKKKDGFFKYYYESGNLSATGFYNSDIINANWNYYFQSGQISAKKTFKFGKVVTAQFYDESGNSISKEKAEFPPVIDWDNNNLEDYIKQQIPKYDIQGNEGKVYVILHINKDGGIEKIIIEDNPNPFLKNIVHTIIQKMPKFKPGKLNNRFSQYYISASFNFKK